MLTPLCFLLLASTWVSASTSFASLAIAPHPRLFLLDADLPQVIALIQTDPTVEWWYDNLVQRADVLVQQNTTVTWNSGDLLVISRTVLDRVSTLAGVYRLTNKTEYAERALMEMKAAANFPGWHPQDFLDTAEMMNALAIGYDWLYNYMSPKDKTLLESAFYDKGFHYYIEFNVGNWTSDPQLAGCFLWTNVTFNWNQVCNGGTTVAAIALWDVYPELTASILKYTLSNLPFALTLYGPDGAWDEGPMYWGYATSYLSYMMGAMLTAFGTDFGLVSTFPYLPLTGNFHIYTLTNNFLYFPFGDSMENAVLNWEMVMMGRIYNNSLYIAHERALSTHMQLYSWSQPYVNINILHVFYSRAQDSKLSFPANFSDLSTDAYFRNTEVVTSRNNWNWEPTPDYFYVAIKGGNTLLNHQHLDLGSFVIEKSKIPFIYDLGLDNYSLPGYFNNELRYEWYRLSSRGHNTLTFNGDNNQIVTNATVIEYQPSNEETYVKIDLTNAYATNATSVTRSLRYTKNQGVVVISDEIVPNKNTSTVTWRVQSLVNITASGSHATMQYNGTTLNADILSPKNVDWQVVTVNLKAPEYVALVHVLQFQVSASENMNLTVQFS